MSSALVHHDVLCIVPPKETQQHDYEHEQQGQSPHPKDPWQCHLQDLVSKYVRRETQLIELSVRRTIAELPRGG